MEDIHSVGEMSGSERSDDDEFTGRDLGHGDDSASESDGEPGRAALLDAPRSARTVSTTRSEKRRRRRAKREAREQGESVSDWSESSASSDAGRGRGARSRADDDLTDYSGSDSEGERLTEEEKALKEKKKRLRAKAQQRGYAGENRLLRKRFRAKAERLYAEAQRRRLERAHAPPGALDPARVNPIFFGYGLRTVADEERDDLRRVMKDDEVDHMAFAEHMEAREEAMRAELTAMAKARSAREMARKKELVEREKVRWWRPKRRLARLVSFQLTLMPRFADVREAGQGTRSRRTCAGGPHGTERVSRIVAREAGRTARRGAWR